MHGPVMHTVTASALECHAASEASAFVFGISLNFSGLSGPYNRLGRRRSATISQDEGPACSVALACTNSDSRYVYRDDGA